MVPLLISRRTRSRAPLASPWVQPPELCALEKHKVPLRCLENRSKPSVYPGGSQGAATLIHQCQAGRAPSLNTPPFVCETKLPSCPQHPVSTALLCLALQSLPSKLHPNPQLSLKAGTLTALQRAFSSSSPRAVSELW